MIRTALKEKKENSATWKQSKKTSNVVKSLA